MARNLLRLSLKFRIGLLLWAHSQAAFGDGEFDFEQGEDSLTYGGGGEDYGQGEITGLPGGFLNHVQFA